jgi:hypothetical protein
MLIIKTDVRMVESDDEPNPKPKANLAKKPVRPMARPVTKNSQRSAKVPNVADQGDLTTDNVSSVQKSNHISKLLFLFLW